MFYVYLYLQTIWYRGMCLYALMSWSMHT